MRLTFHWRGKPLIALDLVAMSPDDDEQGPALQASASLQDVTRAEPTDPDTRAFGIGPRPEWSA